MIYHNALSFLFQLESLRAKPSAATQYPKLTNRYESQMEVYGHLGVLKDMAQRWGGGWSEVVTDDKLVWFSRWHAATSSTAIQTLIKSTSRLLAAYGAAAAYTRARSLPPQSTHPVSRGRWLAEQTTRFQRRFLIGHRTSRHINCVTMYRDCEHCFFHSLLPMHTFRHKVFCGIKDILCN